MSELCPTANIFYPKPVKKGTTTFAGRSATLFVIHNLIEYASFAKLQPFPTMDHAQGWILGTSSGSTTLRPIPHHSKEKVAPFFQQLPHI